jgi:putative ABC transport system ATP-binding protein
MSCDALIGLTAVSKRFPGPPPRVVLHDLEFTLRAGEYVAIMGESGVGKSTLLNLMAGLERPDAGAIRFDGVDLAGLDDAAATRLRRRHMGFVFQAFHVLPHLTVGQNVSLPLLLNGVPRSEARERVAAMLAAVGLAGRDASLPRELSGGEMQRVAIARALVHAPKLILADEPTGNLDQDTAEQIQALLRDRVKRTGAAGILVTHSPRAAATAERVLLLTARGLHEHRV